MKDRIKKHIFDWLKDESLNHYHTKIDKMVMVFAITDSISQLDIYNIP